MDLVLIRVGQREPGVGYRLDILVDDGSDPGWRTAPRASEWLPEDLGADHLRDWGVENAAGVVATLRERILGGDRPEVPQAVGEHLYRLLAQGEVKDWWDDVAARPARFGLQVVDGDLAQLPWELLRRNAGYLFTDETRPWFRLDAEAEVDGTPAEIAWNPDRPLRILIVVGSEEKDAAIRAEDEVREIVEAIAASRLPIEWHVERRPPHQRLQGLLVCMQPDIFHSWAIPSAGYERTTHLVRMRSSSRRLTTRGSTRPP